MGRKDAGVRGGRWFLLLVVNKLEVLRIAVRRKRAKSAKKGEGLLL